MVLNMKTLECDYLIFKKVNEKYQFEALVDMRYWFLSIITSAGLRTYSLSKSR
jgi:hypothetical protein